MNILSSPQSQDTPLSWGQQSPDELDEMALLKVKLFFYCDQKAVRARVFPEEWYTVVSDEYGAD